jgi:hypothetical protein
MILDLNDLEPHELQVPTPSMCSRVSALRPTAISADLFIDRYCFPGDGAPLAGAHEVVKLDLIAGVAVSIATVPWGPDAFAKLPNDAWLASYDSGFCGWIDRLPGTADPGHDWPLMVSDEPTPFAVNSGREAADCGTAPQATRIAGAPDGALAFLARPAVDSGGVSSLDLPRRLYVVDAGGAPRRLVDETFGVLDIAWRPDGTAIGVAGTIEGQTGLWILARDGSRTLAVPGNVSAIAWSPDGRSIAMVIREESDGDPNSITRLKILSLDPSVFDE